VIRPRLAAPIALVLLGCHPSATPSAMDPALSARVPPATVALAGVNLDRLRKSGLYPKLPLAAQSFLEPFSGAHQVLIAYTGVELLTIARGVVPGATQVAPDLALSGAGNLVAAAIAAHPAAGILTAAQSVAAARPIWIAVRGGVALPLEGNLANVNNLLRDAEYVTFSVQLGDPLDLELFAQCPTPQAALRFEQSFRALVSLGVATNPRQPAISGVLQSTRIGRQERAVHISLSVPADALAKVLF
jgi:hypothetical protein